MLHCRQMNPRRMLVVVTLASLLAGCGVDYARSISERAFARGEGEATVAEIFGAAARTCVGIGDREEALAALDAQARQALDARGRDQYTVVIAQFDEADRVILQRRFHIRNAFVYVDIDEPTYAGSAARCLGPTDVVQVELVAPQNFASVQIP